MKTFDEMNNFYKDGQLLLFSVYIIVTFIVNHFNEKRIHVNNEISKVIKEDDYEKFKELVDNSGFNVSYQNNILDELTIFKRVNMMSYLINNTEDLEEYIQYYNNLNSDILGDCLFNKLKTVMFREDMFQYLIDNKCLKLIEENIDYFIDLDVNFDVLFEFHLIIYRKHELIEKLYNKGCKLPEKFERVITESIDMKMLLLLERFENFDDFFMKNRLYLLRCSDDETMLYIISKF